MEHKFTTQQYLPIPVLQAWTFFSAPGNLKLITPPDMEFRIMSDLTGQPIHEGMQIDYIVRPIAGIPVRWKTRIGKTVPLQEFTDMQLKGPYRKWEHHHRFEPFGDGTLMTDTVIYRLPFGTIGELLHRLVIRRRIEYIFEFRETTLKKLFGTYAG